MHPREITNWKDVEPKMVIALLPYCDGWVVLDPEILKVEKFPPKIVDKLSQFHRPKKGGKHCVYDRNEKPAKGIHGVFSLDLLFDIALDLGLLTIITRAKNKLAQDEQAAILLDGIEDHYSRNSGPIPKPE